MFTRRLMRDMAQPGIYTARIFMMFNFYCYEYDSEKQFREHFEPILQNLSNMSISELHELQGNRQDDRQSAKIVLYKNGVVVASNYMNVNIETTGNYFEDYQQWYEQKYGSRDVPFVVYMDRSLGIEDNEYHFTYAPIMLTIYKLVEYIPNIDIDDFRIEDNSGMA